MIFTDVRNSSSLIQLVLACTIIIATPVVGWNCTELAICSRLLARVARFSLFMDRLIWVKDDLGDESRSIKVMLMLIYLYRKNDHEYLDISAPSSY